ncbi:cytochrome P450 [Sciscionella marina]|uniref:cytochrome P450 n=1 Tax=Sciscionella marina TaxID=508770 RepID=UPI0003A2A1EC|nr:cytochrome P450 [Sciscionella marina]
MQDSASQATVDSAEIPDYPMSRAAQCPLAPPPAARSMAADRPLVRVRIWDGSTPWLVTGHPEQRALLSDPRVSVDERRSGFPFWSQAMAATVDQRPGMVFNLDAPEHNRLRRIMTRPFTVKRIQALRPSIQHMTDELIDAMLAGATPADLVTALALPLPSMMISELLGVPYADHQFFQHHSSVGVDRSSTAEQNAAATGALLDYLDRLVAAKTSDPGDDVLSDFAERVHSGEITTREAALLAVQLLVAGHETSANMISLGALALLQNPQQRALVEHDDEPGMIANATEEMLRYLTIPHVGQRRIATEDIEIGGQTIHAGEGIILDLPAANWDPRVFSEPEQLDLHRTASKQLAFGYGRHQCVGQHLARAELQIVYRTLFRRVPTLRLATTVDRLEFKHDHLAYGVHTLPITW